MITILINILFSNTLIVKRGDVQLLINNQTVDIKKDQNLTLEKGSTVCFISGDGIVNIKNTNRILKRLHKNRSQKCYTLPIKNNMVLPTKKKANSSRESTRGIREFTSDTKEPALPQVNKDNVHLSKSIISTTKNKSQKREYASIEILYGTDRKKTFEKNNIYPYENYYGNTGIDDLIWGVAEITIPLNHKDGAMERPKNTWYWSEKEQKDKHIIVSSLKELKIEEFSNLLQKKLLDAEEKDILIFIHGFNNTFSDAVRRTAQLSYDLSFKGVPMTYSWPSQGNNEVLTYMKDEDSVQYTQPHLVKFLSHIIDTKGKGTNIHIIGHSMGTRAVTNALKELSYIYQNKKVFKNIILAAPDIDSEVFKVNLLPYITKTTDIITLYASSDDNALKISKTLHMGDRLGQSDNIFIFSGMNTIDATGIDTSSLGHSYFAEKKILVKDLKDIIEKSLPPENRNQTLIQKFKAKLIYWKIIKDQ